MHEWKSLSQVRRKPDDFPPELAGTGSLTGAPGQLLIDSHIKSVVPAEVAAAYDVKNPVQMARSALRVIVKNLWDFEEMMRRGLIPTDNEPRMN